LERETLEVAGAQSALTALGARATVSLDPGEDIPVT
jgi:hypothetical protein